MHSKALLLQAFPEMRNEYYHHPDVRQAGVIDPDLKAIVVYKLRDKAVHIAYIWVEREHRRKGMAADLVKWVMNEAYKLGYQKLTANVRMSNMASVQLFKHMGFKTSKTLALYNDGERKLRLYVNKQA